MLIETYDGLLSQMLSLRSGWLRTLRVGLYTGEFVPNRNATIEDLEPCTWSGYVGLRDMLSWATPAMAGQRAIIQHGYYLYHHDGGPVAQRIQGYYVVDHDGVLAWAEAAGEPVPIMQSLGNTYRLVPRYSLRSEFGG